ncbi:MAG TPA: iron ABC transporter permease [Acidimicrobiales bacterium]|nr:iron ABC transporter permease [Acidimicrobiales bacterium]
MATITVPERPRPGLASRLDTRALLRHVGVAAFVLGLGYLVVAPLVRLQGRAFADDGYERAFTGPRIGRTITYTIGLAVGSLVIALVLGTLLAWAATRLPRRLGFLRLFPILPIVVPAIANVVGWAFLLSPRPGYLNAWLRKLPWWNHLTEGPIDVYTMPWIVIITGFGLTAFVYLFVSAGFENIGSEHIEAAQVSGSPPWKVFLTVTLPLLRPTLIYGGGVALLLGLGQFTGPLLLGANGGISVITTDMYRQVSQTPVEYGVAAALGSPLLVFGIVVVLVQKLLLGNQRRFVTHGGRAFRSGGRPSRMAAVAIVLYALVATVLPIAALVVVSLSNFWSGEIQTEFFSLNNFRTIFEHASVTEAIGNSVRFSLVAVAISLPLGFVAASLLVRGRQFRVQRAILDFVVSMPLGIPAVIFGVGFLLTYTEGPFVLYGTPWVVILVYVTLMMPFATRMQLSALIALGDAYTEASRVSGAGVLRTNLRVILPLMRSSLGGAAALMFVLLTHEFSASLLVRSSTTQVMGTVLFDYWGNGGYPLVAAVALVMTLVTAIGVAVAMALGGSESLTKL